MQIERSEATKRDDSIAHTYRFCTNILAVNREINKEASPILNANHIVVVNHKWPQASTLKHGIGLPIVTENQTHVSRFRKAILKVQLVAPSTEEGFSEQKSESFIMVSDDLPALANVFQWLVYCTNTQAKIVTRYNTGPEFHSTVNQDLYAFAPEGMGTRPALTVRFPEGDGTSVDRATQESILHALGSIACGRMEVKVHNFD